MELAITLLLAAVFAGLVYFARKVGSVTADRDQLVRLQAELDQRTKELAGLQPKLQQAESLQVENARLETELEHERREGAEKLKQLQDAEERLKKDFENLAGRIFEEKSKTFSTQSREGLEGLLKPFREQIDEFRKRVDVVHLEETKHNAQLIEQVRQLAQLSNKVSEDANNLAVAIKGDSKRQGDWGEIVVERIFESSGLVRGVQFETQVSMKDGDGAAQRPDFIVYLPKEKAVIVDAKVSLRDYDCFCRAEGAEQEEALRRHISAVRAHVATLQQKSYEQLLGNRSLDFVIMCIPVEPAYQLALQHDESLLYDLAARNVVIVGPTTLMITLKVIAQIWRRENENRNAEKIAATAGQLYDKIVGAFEALENAQRQLDSVGNSVKLAMDRMKSGRGSALRQLEELRLLGAKVKKQLPAHVLDALEDAPGENSEQEEEA